MSSTYRHICVSHDPGIVLPHDWTSSRGGREVAEALAKAPSGYPQMCGHEGCDLLVLRYSGGLVEVACPGHDKPVRHQAAAWVRVPWLRLLWLAHQEPAGSRLKDAAQDHRLAPCWTFDRVHRLRRELGLEDG